MFKRWLVRKKIQGGGNTSEKNTLVLCGVYAKWNEINFFLNSVFFLLEFCVESWRRESPFVSVILEGGWGVIVSMEVFLVMLLRKNPSPLFKNETSVPCRRMLFFFEGPHHSKAIVIQRTFNFFGDCSPRFLSLDDVFSTYTLSPYILFSKLRVFQKTELIRSALLRYCFSVLRENERVCFSFLLFPKWLSSKC